MIMTPLTTTNQVVIHPVSFTHQCADQSAIRGTLDVILFVQIVMCIGILTLVNRLSPSCPPTKRIDNDGKSDTLTRMNLLKRLKTFLDSGDHWVCKHWMLVTIILGIMAIIAGTLCYFAYFQ